MSLWFLKKMCFEKDLFFNLRIISRSCFSGLGKNLKILFTCPTFDKIPVHLLLNHDKSPIHMLITFKKINPVRQLCRKKSPFTCVQLLKNLVDSSLAFENLIQILFTFEFPEEILFVFFNLKKKSGPHVADFWKVIPILSFLTFVKIF